jgi:3-isopropylmalate/(R)-2-methylmalate dehydratase small subunit
MKWIYKGKCWKFGDNLGIDGDVMPLRFALERELNPNILKDHLMAGIDPTFPNKVAKGDIIVAGKRFGQGNPHIQGFLGIAGHELGLVAESIPRGSFRNAINAGLPFLSGCIGITQHVETGDDLEVNFQDGIFKNLTQDYNNRFKPLDPKLQAVIEIGGWHASFEQRLINMRSSK